MARKGINRIIHSLCVLATVTGLLVLAGECRAFPYEPAGTLSLLSEYAASSNSASPHSQVWKVVPGVDNEGATILRFLPEASAGAGMVCEIRISSAGTVGEIQWTGMGKNGQKKSGSGLLLMPGFPAPCDILPVRRTDNVGVYGERIEAGGRVFSKSYRVSLEPISVNEAKSMGWIRVEDPGMTGLIMVAVTDERGRPVVKQLWTVDGSWWIYEETSLRRSWLVN